MKTLLSHRRTHVIALLSALVVSVAWAVHGELDYRKSMRDQIARFEGTHSDLAAIVQSVSQDVQTLDRAVVALVHDEDPSELTPDIGALLHTLDERVGALNQTTATSDERESLEAEFVSLTQSLLQTERSAYAELLLSIQSRLQLLEALTIEIADEAIAMQVLNALDSARGDLAHPIPADLGQAVIDRMAACERVIATVQYNESSQQLLYQFKNSAAFSTIAQRSVGLLSVLENSNRLAAVYATKGVDVSGLHAIAEDAKELLALDVRRQASYEDWAQSQLTSFAAKFDAAMGYTYDDEDAIINAIQAYLMPIDATKISQQLRGRLDQLAARSFAELDESEVASATRYVSKITPEMF